MKTNLPDTSRPATVLICSNDAVFRGHLTRLLGEICPCRVTATQCPAEAVKIAAAQPPDLFICFHEPPAVDGVELVSELRKKVWVPVLLAARDWSLELVKAAVAAGTAAFLNSFPGQTELAMALYEAKARVDHEDELRRKLQDVEQRLADRKLIEKAKGLLMEQQQLSEDAAFRLMRNLAMTRRITMAKVAEGVITKIGRPDLP
jgi:AmiR/NasT family two-component response regulator